METSIQTFISMCQWDTSSLLIFSDNVFGALIYYSHFIALIVALLVGIFVLSRDSKVLVNRLLFLIMTAFSLWVFFDLILWGNEKPDLIMFFWSMMLFIEPLIYALCVYFIDVFIEKKDISLNKKIGIFSLLLPVIILLPTKFALVGFDLTNCFREPIEGFIATYYVYFIEVIYTLWIIVFAVRKYKKAAPTMKNQIIFITIGIILFLLSFVSGNIIGSLTDNWTLAQIGLFGMPIFAGFLAYMIVRFKTFNAKLLGAQVLVIALGFLVLAIVFVRSIENIRLVVAFTLLFVLILGRILIKSVKREVEQRERLEILTKELEVANEKLKGLDKLKTEFLSLASHQLRTPLTAIKGYASMLFEGSFGKMEDKQEDAVKRIYTSAQGLVNVVEDLLNVSKIEQGGMKYEFSPTDLSALVIQLYGEMKVPAETKKLEFSLEMDQHDKFIVSADATKLKQVFLNLTDNSIKYTPKGFVKISLKREGSNIVFKVSDNGMGISPETKAKLFEKFSRGEGGKTNTGGSGLGLYLAQQIARAHKGDIVIESDGLGKGSSFIVTLLASGSYPN